MSNAAVLCFLNFLPGITLGGNYALPPGSLSLPPPFFFVFELTGELHTQPSWHPDTCSFSWAWKQSFLTLWEGCLGRSTSSSEFLCLSGQYLLWSWIFFQIFSFAQLLFLITVCSRHPPKCPLCFLPISSGQTCYLFHSSPLCIWWILHSVQHLLLVRCPS